MDQKLKSVLSHRGSWILFFQGQSLHTCFRQHVCDCLQFLLSNSHDKMGVWQQPLKILHSSFAKTDCIILQHLFHFCPFQFQFLRFIAIETSKSNKMELLTIVHITLNLNKLLENYHFKDWMTLILMSRHLL